MLAKRQLDDREARDHQLRLALAGTTKDPGAALRLYERLRPKTKVASTDSEISEAMDQEAAGASNLWELTGDITPEEAERILSEMSQPGTMSLSDDGGWM